MYRVSLLLCIVNVGLYQLEVHHGISASKSIDRQLHHISQDINEHSLSRVLGNTLVDISRSHLREGNILMHQNIRRGR